MRCRREWGVLGLLLLVPTVLVVFSRQTVRAATQVCPTYPTNAHDGFVVSFGNSAHVEGATSSNTIQDIRYGICFHYPLSGFTNAYAMVYGYNGTASPPYSGYAQIGFIYAPDLICCERYFWQWDKDETDSGGASTTYFGNPLADGVGSVQTFKVVRNQTVYGDGHLHMLLNNVQAPPNMAGQPAATNFDPLNAWPTWSRAEFSGETYWQADDMPGYVGSKEDFANVREYDGSSWSSHLWNRWPESGGNALPCFYNRSVTTSYQEFKIWTDPVNHSC